jgi:seryl-tRNA synthetase
MLDLRLIRERPDFVKAEIAKLYSAAPIDDILRLDERRRSLLTESEVLKAERNEGSRQISRTLEGAARDELVAHLRAVGDRIAELDAQVAQVDAELQANLLQVPNLPDPDVPVGRDESENVISDVFGALPEFEFEPKPHWDLAQALGIIDFERGVKISGSRFYLLRGAGARLQRALISWFLDVHGRTPGLTEVYPPVMVREPALVGTGNLPKFGDALYRDEEAGLWWIPTAEVPVTNMYGEEILDGAELPIHHFAYSACFRREQFSSGRDVRGIKRGHQFDKVEIVKFVHPDTSDDELHALVETGAALLAQLGIAYRKVQMCTGDLSFVAAKKIDLEAWAPGCGEWLEVSSCSNFRDFQARRANIRFRPVDGGRPQFVHTLNGSALALPRTLIAVIENNQQEDGSIVVPDVLRPYLHGVERISRENAR